MKTFHVLVPFVVTEDEGLRHALNPTDWARISFEAEDEESASRMFQERFVQVFMWGWTRTPPRAPSIPPPESGEPWNSFPGD